MADEKTCWIERGGTTCGKPAYRYNPTLRKGICIEHFSNAVTNVPGIPEAAALAFVRDRYPEQVGTPQFTPGDPMAALEQELLGVNQLVQNLGQIYARQSESFEHVAKALVVLLDVAKMALPLVNTAGENLSCHTRLDAAIARADAALRLLRANATNLGGLRVPR